MPKVSVIIRCYNEEAHIGRLLSGIMQQSGEIPEIIVVDSGSTDATRSIVAQYPAKILAIDKDDFSFGHSLNIGCAAATGDFLVFASAHVYPLYADWIEQLVHPFENDWIACVYGRQVGNDATRFSERQVFARWFPEQSDMNQNHPFCNNANAAVRQSVWKRFRYDETLTGLEDLAWARQVLSAGFRIAYKADAEVVHVHQETRSQVMNRYRREAIAMKAIFPHEEFSFMKFIKMFFRNAYNDARLALKQGVFWQNMSSILSFRLMQFWGTYRGYAQHGVVSKTLRRKFYYPHDGARSADVPLQAGPGREKIDYSGHERGKGPTE